MGTADEQIRVSETVKRKIEHHKREGESYNDTLDRLLDNDRDLLAGFGRWSDEHAENVREQYQKGKQKSKERMQELKENCMKVLDATFLRDYLKGG